MTANGTSRAYIRSLRNPPVANGGTNLSTTPSNGQLLIGNGTNYTLATLTDGSGITITEGSGTITVASTLGTTIEGSEITDGTIEEVDLEATNSPTDNYVLTFDNTSGGFTWVDPGTIGGGSISVGDSIGSATQGSVFFAGARVSCAG